MANWYLSIEEWEKFKDEGYRLLEKYVIKKEQKYEYTEEFAKSFFGGLYSSKAITDFVSKCSLPLPRHLKEMLGRIVIFLKYWTEIKHFSITNAELNSVVVTLFWIMCSEMGYKHTLLWDTSVLDFYGRKLEGDV